MHTATFPFARPRRLRASPFIRELTQETHLRASDLVLPLFVQEGAESTAIPSLPSISRLSLAALAEQAKRAYASGIQAVALFPVTPSERKTEDGAEALNPDNLICRAIKTVKDACPYLGVIADVALDPYTTHGHDGLVDEKGYVHNDVTVDILARQALTLAQAGADVVAPSDMMDGRVGAIRMALETEGFYNTIILAYAAKYASSFYGPFRNAVGSNSYASANATTTQPYLDKRTYQMNPANVEEALREVALDIQEGADMVMVKPALPYLDVIYRIKQEFHVPVAAYHVSGEFAAIKHAAAAGAFDEQAAMLESLMAIKRAGANVILTYAALDVAEML